MPFEVVARLDDLCDTDKWSDKWWPELMIYSFGSSLPSIIGLRMLSFGALGSL